MTGVTSGSPIRAVLIDLDGTLLDTVPDLARAADAMLAELGRAPAGEAVVKTLVGKGLQNLVRRCLALEAEPAEADFERAMDVYRRHYAAVNGERTVIYPGVLEGLEMLRGMGLPMGCVTNKAAQFSEPLLEMLGLRRYFSVMVSGDSLPEKKPHPLPLLHMCGALGVPPAETLLIGDSINDVQAARAAGCPVFIVPYGYNEGRDVRELDCDAIVSGLDEAARLIASRAVPKT